LIEPSTQFFNPVQMRYLFCKTQKSTVLACRKEKESDTGWYNTDARALYLQEDVNRPVIGILRPHNDEQFSQLAHPGSSHHVGGKPNTQRIEVVAINRGIEFSNRKDSTERGASVVRKEFVTVLWVEWEGVVALRRASGRIEREAWEALELEEIDLVLG
jgi:hypothetical protein